MLGIIRHASILIDGLIINDIFICPVSCTFRFVEQEVRCIMGNISDCGKISDTDVQPDRSAVDRTARIVEGKSIIFVAVKSSAKRG